MKRDDNYGECEQCKQHNTSPAWCKSCDPEKIIQGWTSGVKDVDDCIKEFQLKTTKYENIIEWISFDKLSNIEKIGEGGFSLVFSAIWLDGTRKIEGNYGNYTRSREKSSIIALKTFSNSKLNVLDFLNEFKGCMNFKLKDSGLKIYGITRNTENEYLMVFQYANRGNFYHFLKSDFKQLTWKSKLQQLVYISFNLAKIHKEGYIHGNFHSGNILQNQENNESIQSYITDLVLFKKNIEHFSEKIIYGVMPYFAPEVLLGQHYSQAADIYSLGIIMTEISTGVRPFDGYLFDKELASKICKGLRPELAPETPNCYIELVKQCTDSDPLKRPTANDVGLKLYKWLDVILYLPDNDEGLDIRNKFLDADNVIQTLPTIPQIHPDFMYTSKAINTQEIKDILDSRQI